MGPRMARRLVAEATRPVLNRLAGLPDDTASGSPRKCLRWVICGLRHQIEARLQNRPSARSCPRPALLLHCGPRFSDGLGQACLSPLYEPFSIKSILESLHRGFFLGCNTASTSRRSCACQWRAKMTTVITTVQVAAILTATVLVLICLFSSEANRSRNS